MQNEKNILRGCIEQLKLLPPIQEVSVLSIGKKLVDIKIDAEIVVVKENKNIEFYVEIKSILKRPIPNILFELRDKVKGDIILFAEYINPSIAEDLKLKHLNFIDCQGNAFIHIENNLYIDIQGNKYQTIKEKESTTLFQPKGMQLLTLLLSKKYLVNYSFRDLAKISGNSLGKIAKLIKELRNEGYIINSNEGKYSIKDQKLIFNQWLDNYGGRLRPKLLIGTYRISAQSDYSMIAKALEENQFAFGGNAAAEILTNYQKADCIDIFIPTSDTMDVIKKIRLAPTQDYNVRLFNLFSDELIDHSCKFPLVIPILIYAELLYQNNDRTRETARLIFDDHIKKLLQ